MSISTSLWVHIGVLGFIFWLYLDQIMAFFVPHAADLNEVVEYRTPVVIRFVGTKLLDDGREIHIDVPLTPEGVTAYIKARSLELENTNLDDIRSKVDELNAQVRPESMNEIVEWFNLPGFTPVPESAGMPFDYQSMTFYAIRIKEFPDGRGYIITWIDEKGVLKDIEMPPEHVTDETQRLYKIYQLIKANPMLEKLYKGVIIKIVGEMLKTGK